MRAVVGQQDSDAAARTLAARLVARHGEPVPRALAGDDALTHAFPRPLQLDGIDFAALGLPRARAATLAAIVRAALDDPSLFAPGADPARTLERLSSLPGIGAWTAQYVALRALRQADAFPAGDIALQRALAQDGTRPSAAMLERRAEAWRPWRAYAAQHLWTADAAPRARG
jgi:AraC family transcriptional regulator of adaptative response / DNA-3-methyladenine glycosylase II